jgi:glutamine synthetase
MRFAEYIWIDGRGELRGKTKVLSNTGKPPVWSFDGSSTEQASTELSDCKLVPIFECKDPIREGPHDSIVLCEVFDFDDNPDKMNLRNATRNLEEFHKDKEPLFGLEQEYTLFKGSRPLGVKGSIMPTQGPYYCSVGANRVIGRDIAEEHMRACLTAGLKLAGVNAEVMPGQWEYQIGPLGPLDVCDQVWMSRYILQRIAESHGITVSYHPKPIKELNGAGLHTNFSTKSMRVDGGMARCAEAAILLGLDVIEKVGARDLLRAGEIYDTIKYPNEYGIDYQARLTGEHETCSHKQFKYAIGDRSGSIRIPTPVAKKGSGYIEDRRPCANANPYGIVNYILGTTCGVVDV